MHHASAHGSLSFGLDTFHGTAVASTRSVPDPGDGAFDLPLRTPAARWHLSGRSEPDPGGTGGRRIRLRFRLEEGREESVACHAALAIPDWTTDPYVLVPGAVYAGNRFPAEPTGYPPLIVDRERMGPDFPITITDVPRLLPPGEAGDSGFHLLAGDCSIPAAGFFFPETATGLLVLVEPDAGHGPVGIGFRENRPDRQAILRISSPGVRDGRVYTTCNRSGAPSPDRGAGMGPGDELRLELVLCAFPCPDVPALFRRLRQVRMRFGTDVPPDATIPFSAAWAIQEACYNRERWDEKGAYYFSFLKDYMPEIMDFQLGWIGGLQCTRALLLEGGELSRERSLRNLDMVFRNATAASGFLYGAGREGRFYGDGLWAFPWPYGMHSVRRSGDALYFLVRQVRSLERRDPSFRTPAHWRDGIRRLARAFVRLWEQSGQIGQVVEVETGRLLIGGSSAGAIVPAGLVLASGYLGEPDLLAAAEAIGEHLYRHGTARGLTTGGPIEILQCPDSESAYALVESFLALHEATGRPDWLARAVEAADQFASWCVPYDFRWPRGTEFGRLGLRSTDTVVANVQNKHGAPGICTFSGDALFRLFRATGDPDWLDLLRDIAHGLPQYLSRADRPIHDWNGHPLPDGWMCERVNLSDWEGPDRIGGVFSCPCWCEVSNMLSHAELPGVYVRPDTGHVVAMDHVTAALEGEETGSQGLRIGNPTPYPARVRVFVEGLRDIPRHPVPDLADSCLLVDIAPGGDAFLPLAPDGSMTAEGPAEPAVRTGGEGGRP